MSLGALTRLGIAGLVAYAPSVFGKDDPGLALFSALATVLSGYFTNRSNSVDEEDRETIRAAKNHHLQIALAGACRIALLDIQTAKYKDYFDAWENALDAALEDPSGLLAKVIPTNVDLLLEATNPHINAEMAFDETQRHLSSWLEISRPDLAVSPLPDDLLSMLREEFPAGFQRAFAQLLVSNDGTYARRAFERRALEKIDATTQNTLVIVKGIAEHLREQTPPALARIRRFTSKLPVVDRTLFGREKELAFLDEAWANSTTNVVQIIASGGTGKTALMDKWFRRHLEEATVFGWSFYSQGTSEDRQTSSDPFFDEAFRFFKIDTAPTASVYAKADALAEKLRQERVLLLLDGVEPLQDSSGDLKDQALKALLQELDTHNAGLVLCTTRYRINELPDDGGRVLSWNLDNLSPEASLAYLRKIGVSGEDEELLAAAKEYGHHALALTLLGHYLVNFCEADVRRTVEIPKLMVDELKQGRHARRIMAAYEETFAGQFELDILKGLGYFNRPAEPEALKLVMPKMAPLPYLAALKRLHDLRLVLDEEATQSLDCHPLIREHFSQYATPACHERLYKHYQKTDKHPSTIAEMTPLFHAVYHGCQAGRHQEVAERIYRARIMRGDEYYLMKELGGPGINLGLLANFFASPWTQPLNSLSQYAQSWVLTNAAATLHALGRLAEAINPTRRGSERNVEYGDWLNAAIGYNNLSELLLSLGSIADATAAGLKSVEFADRSGHPSQSLLRRATLAATLHQSGQIAAAALLFSEAERIQINSYPPEPQLLYSLQGYQYCDLLLYQGQAEAVRNRAAAGLVIAKRMNRLLDIALDHLSLAQAGESGHLTLAIDGLRRAGYLQYLPLGLLARGTQRDLDEVYKIATRSGMRLHLTDYHLKQADLDLREGRKEKALRHAEEAGKLIQETGYHRRDPELASLREKLDV